MIGSDIVPIYIWVTFFVATEILKSHGYEVEVVETGMKAIEKFTDKQFDIIFMDIGLPDTDGINLTNRMREFELTNQRKSTTIIALTAHKNNEEYDLNIFDKVYRKTFSVAILDEIKQHCIV